MVTIRKATPGDAPGILHCLHLAFAPYRDRYSQAAFEDTTLTSETILQRMSVMTVLVAVSASGDIVGTVACEKLAGSQIDDGHIRGMAVLPAWHGQGVAHRLLLAVEAELLARSCSRMTLDTTA